MPDTEEVKKEKTVDLDTSGPAMDVDIPEQKDEAVIEEKETVKEKKPDSKTTKSSNAKKQDNPKQKENVQQEKTKTVSQVLSLAPIKFRYASFKASLIIIFSSFWLDCHR